jgi:hypothetical protein
MFCPLKISFSDGLFQTGRLKIENAPFIARRLRAAKRFAKTVPPAVQLCRWDA